MSCIVSAYICVCMCFSIIISRRSQIMSSVLFYSIQTTENYGVPFRSKLFIYNFMQLIKWDCPTYLLYEQSHLINCTKLWILTFDLNGCGLPFRSKLCINNFMQLSVRIVQRIKWDYPSYQMGLSILYKMGESQT